MTFTTVLTLILGAIVNIAVLAYGARRLLGEQRFSLSRTVVAGLAGQAVGNAIIGALAAGLPAKIGAKGGERDRRAIDGWIQLGVLTVLAAAAGLMAVALLALKGGPAMTAKVGFHQFLGYCLLVICSLLALRVLAAVFRKA